MNAHNNARPRRTCRQKRETFKDNKDLQFRIGKPNQAKATHKAIAEDIAEDQRVMKIKMREIKNDFIDVEKMDVVEDYIDVEN